MKKWTTALILLLVLATGCGTDNRTEDNNVAIETNEEQSNEPQNNSTPTGDSEEVGETEVVTEEVETEQENETSDVLGYHLSLTPAGSYQVVASDEQPIVDVTFSQANWLEGSHFLVGFDDEVYYLIDLSGATYDVAMTENELNSLIAEKVYGASLVLENDADNWSYGYSKNGKLISDQSYTMASQFMGGYAVVSYGDYFSGTYEIIDEGLNVTYTTDMPLRQLGNGYFGEALESYVYDTYYTSFRVVDAHGSPISDQVFFTVIPLSEGGFFVGDHQKYWFVDEDMVLDSSRSVELSAHYRAIGMENQILFFDGNYSDYPVESISENGDLLYSQLGDEVATITDLGDGYTIEDQVLVEERFTTFSVPMLSYMGDPALFEVVNQEIVQGYGSYESPDVSEVWDEQELSYDFDRFGDILDIYFDFYYYGFGAAHPNYGRNTLHVDLISGKKVTLTDLYTEKVYDRLTTLVQEEANKESDMYFDIASIVVDETTQYNHSDNGIVIYYSPYEVAPYAAGMVEIEIGYDQLQDLLLAGSPYAEALFQN